ncbi:protein-L-isoaspartate O-methyltransferase [Roseibium aquae]|uniref:Protein-L-isoaspartate O-methyltransferase n=1 Tax=Roseibium aquae TaxID=1323746 RepID=A0A916TLD8_9HYPH|nr:protein-L-isoaspartate(D-aspartate) O-methyltransferase [Roseibium aquae]GGB54223.1 protein-L-isoaspartate O-methyltransferase [Roseibium aquae]
MAIRVSDPQSDGSQVLPDEAEARAALVLGLRRRGIGSRELLSAIERVPRRLFLSARHHDLAYEDSPLPIECGQVVSAPSFVAAVLQALSVSSSHSVLEIGTGSGYQAAILGHLAARVDTIDRYRTLADLARQRLAALKMTKVEVHCADGFTGLKSKAPFDRIILTGAVDAVPETLINQLTPDGVLIAPIGPARQAQVLTRISFETGNRVEKQIDRVRLVSMSPGRAQSL